jgi:hypothetical protein
MAVKSIAVQRRVNEMAREKKKTARMIRISLLGEVEV